MVRDSVSIPVSPMTGCNKPQTDRLVEWILHIVYSIQAQKNHYITIKRSSLDFILTCPFLMYFSYRCKNEQSCFGIRASGQSPSPALYKYEAFERCSLTSLSLSLFQHMNWAFGPLFSKFPESNPSAGTISSTSKIYLAGICPFLSISMNYHLVQTTRSATWIPAEGSHPASSPPLCSLHKLLLKGQNLNPAMTSHYTHTKIQTTRLPFALLLPPVCKPASTFHLLLSSPGQPHLISFCSGDHQPCLASGPLLLLFLLAGAPSPLIWLHQVLPRESFLKISPSPWSFSITLLVLFSS